MGSRKGSAKAKRIAEFKAGLGGMDDVFARESVRKSKKAAEKDAALRKKACESRYSCKSDAESAIIACAKHGTVGLHCYKCSYCNGWDLTSKPTR